MRSNSCSARHCTAPMRRCSACSSSAQPSRRLPRCAGAQVMINANWEFHHAIGMACGNRYLERMYTGCLTEGLRIARLTIAYEFYGSEQPYVAHLGHLWREHRELVRVIADRDSLRAASLADSHPYLARKRVTAYLSRNSAHAIEVPGSVETRLGAAD